MARFTLHTWKWFNFVEKWCWPFHWYHFISPHHHHHLHFHNFQFCVVSVFEYVIVITMQSSLYLVVIVMCVMFWKSRANKRFWCDVNLSISSHTDTDDDLCERDKFGKIFSHLFIFIKDCWLYQDHQEEKRERDWYEGRWWALNAGDEKKSSWKQTF